jgi:hypothetical protein
MRTKAPEAGRVDLAPTLSLRERVYYPPSLLL